MAEEKKRLRELINGERGYDIALLTTFNFDFSFFERAILNGFLINDIRKVSVFADEMEFMKSLSVATSSQIGKYYVVNPVVGVRGAFHPKVVLLIGDDRAKLYVASANLTNSGYMVNNEVFNVIAFNKDNRNTLGIINQAIDFFDKINQRTYMMDSELIEEVKGYFPKNDSSLTDRLLFHSCDVPIINQARGVIDEEIGEIWIAVPYYDKDLNALRKLKKEFPNSKIRVFLQNHRSTFVNEINESEHLTDNITVFSGFKKIGTSRFYHGKVILFKGKEKSFILYGSANCTQSALFSTWDDGNLECDFLDIGAVNEYDAFFENMEEDVSGELVTDKLVFHSVDKSDFSFKYGLLDKEAEVHFSFVKKHDGIVSECPGCQTHTKYVNDELIVYIIPDEEKSISNILDIKLLFAGKEEIYRCWLISNRDLEANRTKSKDKSDLSSFDIDGYGEKYRETLLRIYQTDAMTSAELQERRRKLAQIRAVEQEKETASEVDSDEFVVDFDLPDDYTYEYRTMKTFDRIHNMYIDRFVKSTTMSMFYTPVGGIRETVDTDSNGDSEKEEESRKRKATPDDKRFERYIFRRVKGLTSESFLAEVDSKHLLAMVAITIDVFRNYNKENREMVDGVFEDVDVIEKTVDLYVGVLNKPDFDELYEETILMSCYACVIDIYRKSLDVKTTDQIDFYNKQSKRVLSALEKKYNMRETGWLNEERFQSFEAADFDYKDLIKYIDRILGYKTESGLLKYIQSVYGDASVRIEGGKMQIMTTVDSFKSQWRPDTGILKEIRNYSRNEEKIDEVRIILNKNPDVVDWKKNDSTALIHRINMQYQHWTMKKEYADGSSTTSKTEAIMF